MKKLIAGSMIVLSSIGSAHAWGDREQGALAGAAVVWALMQGRQAYPAGQPPVVVGQQPVIVGQAPVIIHPGQPVYRQHCWPQQVGRDPWTGVPFYETRCRLQQY